MSGMALTTVSPSRTSSSRSTPCVEGCCGPNETVIRVSESGSGFRSIQIEDVGTTISFACTRISFNCGSQGLATAATETQRWGEGGAVVLAVSHFSVPPSLCLRDCGGQTGNQ